MEIVTQWIRPAPAIGGQDHLGTQAPSVAIYSSLLPGLTNLTGRARYYSFYPWFLWRLEKRHPMASAATLMTFLRRAECLFALIGARHGARPDEREDAHGATMVGRDVLVPALAGLSPEGALTLSTYAAKGAEAQYFNNPLGGLAQYYFGSLRDLGVLGGDLGKRELLYTTERGLPLAQAFGTDDPGDAFFALIEADRVTAADLDGLAALCPCGLLHNETERRLLVDLLLDPAEKLGEEAQPRRSSFALLLDLAARGGGRSDVPLDVEMRSSAYRAAFVSGEPWDVPEAQARALGAWGAYQRNELLSIALLGVFWAALESCVAEEKTRFPDALALARSFGASIVDEALPPALLGETLSEAVQRTKRELPPLASGAEEGHEMLAAARLFVVTSAKRYRQVVMESVAILLALLARDEGLDPYADCGFDPGYFERYPLNLRSLFRWARGEWATLPVGEVVRRLTARVIEAHFRVAFQKLAQTQSRDTFKVRPLDGELQILEGVPPGYTGPRLQRAVVFLQDLGLLQRRGSTIRVSPTPLGLEMLEVLRG